MALDTEAAEKLNEALANTADEPAVTAKEELLELSSMYREADEKEKAAKKQKEALRGPIMDLISEAVRDEVPLATKVVTVPQDDINLAYDGDIRKWAALKYPEWTVENIVPEPDGLNYSITIRENDALVKYEFSVDGYKFGRTVQHGSPTVDAEGLHGDEEFSALGAEDVVQEVVIYELDESKAARFLASHPESAAVFARHTRPGAVTAKLLPFKAMKEDA